MNSQTADSLAMPALAGLLILTAWKMPKPHKWRRYLQARVSDWLQLILKLVLTVFADLTVGIGVGVSIGLCFAATAAQHRHRERLKPPNR